jgi:hypothetical protein
MSSRPSRFEQLAAIRDERQESWCNVPAITRTSSRRSSRLRTRRCGMPKRRYQMLSRGRTNPSNISSPCCPLRCGEVKTALRRRGSSSPVRTSNVPRPASCSHIFKVTSAHRCREGWHPRFLAASGMVPELRDPQLEDHSGLLPTPVRASSKERSLNDPDRTSDRERVVAALRELVEALDRRVPHVERLGEVRIAREAAALRKEAANRLEELTLTQPDRQAREDARSAAEMTDDGGPLPEK